MTGQATLEEVQELTPLQRLEQRVRKISPSLIETLHARLWRLQQICPDGSIRFFDDHDPMDLVWQVVDKDRRHVMTGLLHYDKERMCWSSHT